MVKMVKKGLFILLVIFIVTSCGEYQRLLKSTDPELKYNAAVAYFEKRDFMRAQTLFDDVVTYYKGTERSQDVLNYLARCYVGQKDYGSAIEYYDAYLRNFPKGRYIIETRYMIGHCYYLSSPDARLDQTETKKGIENLTLFTELYPESPYAAQAREELEELYDKLAEKEVLSAQLYYNLGTYLGNNYESCVIVARNALKKYPGNQYRGELNWLVLQASYQIYLNSVEEKKAERLRDAEDECYNFITEFPDSKYRKAAEKIQKDIITQTKKLQTQTK